MTTIVIPRTHLGFIYYVTWDASYRVEMHHDIREALRRFGVTPERYTTMRDSESSFPEGFTFEAFQKASFEIERAAYGVRRNGAFQLPPPDDDFTMMPAAAKELFNQLKPVLAYELAHGRVQVPSKESLRVQQPSLLRHVLWSFYDPDFPKDSLPALGGPRGPTSKPPIVLPKVQPTPERGALNGAWEKVVQMLNADPRPNFQTALDSPELDAVCDALAYQYDFLDWTVC